MQVLCCSGQKQTATNAREGETSLSPSGGTYKIKDRRHDHSRKFWRGKISIVGEKNAKQANEFRSPRTTHLLAVRVACAQKGMTIHTRRKESVTVETLQESPSSQPILDYDASTELLRSFLY